MQTILKIQFLASPDINFQSYKSKVLRKLSVNYKKIVITNDNPSIIFLCDNKIKFFKDFNGIIIPYESDFLNLIKNHIENNEQLINVKYPELNSLPKLEDDFYLNTYSKPKITPNSYFDEIYCINIKRCKERWNKVFSKFQRENIITYRWEGFDKNEEFIKENFNKIEKKFIRNGYYDQSYSLGTCAIYLTHLELLKYIKNNTSDEKILILEDDITFHKNFAYLFEKQVNIIPENWDMWYLALNQNTEYWDYCKFDNTHQYFKPYENWGCFGFAIKRTILDDLINKFEERYYNKFSSDAVLVEDFQKNSKYNIYASFPSLIGHAYGKSERCDRMFTEEITKKHIPSIYFDPQIYI